MKFKLIMKNKQLILPLFTFFIQFLIQTEAYGWVDTKIKESGDTTYYARCDESWGAKLSDDKTGCICSIPGQTLLKIQSQKVKNTSSNVLNKIKDAFSSPTYTVLDWWGCGFDNAPGYKVSCTGGAKFDGKGCVCEDPSKKIQDISYGFMDKNFRKYDCQ